MSALAITSLVLGIVCLLLAIIPVFNLLVVIPGVLAIVFGIIAIFVANGIKRRGRPLCIAGAALGVVGGAAVFVVNLTYGGLAWDMAESATGSSDDIIITIDPTTVDTSAAGGTVGTPEDPLAFGTTVTTSDGVVIQVGSPTEITTTDSSRHIYSGQGNYSGPLRRGSLILF